MDCNEIVVPIIVNGGNARSFSMEAIMFAKDGDIAAARDSLKQADIELNAAHKLQTDLIYNES